MFAFRKRDRPVGGATRSIRPSSRESRRYQMHLTLSALSVSFYLISIAGTFQWTSGRPVLSNLNISVSRGSLVAVVGEVGSGAV